MPSPRQRRSVLGLGFGLVLVAVALLVFIHPAVVVVRAIFDPSLNAPGIPVLARRLHQDLTPRFERWAVDRVAGGQAAHVSMANVSGTEWPLFGSVFYLRAEEAMQEAWERDHTLLATEPRVQARGAIEAAARLVADPNHATWVRRYWGDTYLEREDLFYRMLLISALVSHRRLTGSEEFVALLRTQSDGLAAELAASPYGLLDDYPHQCYPTDCLEAWEAIARADRVLGTDHGQLIAKARRGFTGKRVSELGLPPFGADARTGAGGGADRASGESAGVGFCLPGGLPRAGAFALGVAWRVVFSRRGGGGERRGAGCPRDARGPSAPLAS